MVIKRLRMQLAESGACGPKPDVQLCLACGRISTENDRKALRKLFDRRGWGLLDEVWLRDHLGKMSKMGYENQVSALVAKLLLRGRIERPKAE